ncbi:hypothetical protein [Lysinibacillus sp. NPDC056232]|uniref:hypothetical protein n=1 Tax=Lysinibacillus sp. NPDC056232 TaxID=3345756 RepID=UPI0035D9F49D
MYDITYAIYLFQNPDALFICAKAKRQQQLCQREIDISWWEWRLGDSLGISNRAKAKSNTSCDNALVTNIVLARRPQESAQSERKSTTRYGGDPIYLY